MSNFTTPKTPALSTGSQEPVNIAVVGYGYWGQIISKNLSSSNSVKVTYICDANANNRNSAEFNHQDSKVVADVAEALADPTVDLLIIATPTNSHFALAKMGLAAKKHVFVEKPFVQTIEQAQELKQLAVAAKREIFVDHTFIFTNEVEAIKELVTSGALGEIRMIDSCRMNFGKFQPDVNVAWDLGPHDLSIVHYLLGDEDPLAYYAEGSDCLGRGLEDTVNLSFKFRNNTMAYIHLSWISPRKERRMIVSGSERMLIYDDSEPEMKLRLYDNKLIVGAAPSAAQINYTYKTGNVTIPHVGNGMALVKEFDYVASVIRGEVSNTKNNVDDAIWVMRALGRCDSILRRERLAANFDEMRSDTHIA